MLRFGVGGFLAACCSHSGSAERDLFWLDSRWQTAIERARIALQVPESATVQWTPSRAAEPISCAHLEFRRSEYSSLMETQEGTMRSAPRGRVQDAFFIEVARLAQRATYTFENYSTDARQAETVIKHPTAAQRWIIVRINGTLEISDLQGGQDVGVTFSRNVDGIHIRVRLPLDAVCNQHPLEVFLLPNCLADSKLQACDAKSASWYSIGVPPALIPQRDP